MKKYIAYYRVSRKEQGISGLGLSAQKSSVLKYVSSQDGLILNEYTEIETGTNKRERIEIHKAIQQAKDEGAVLVIAKLDRLARNVSFVSSLMDTGIEFLAVDMPSANNFTIHIFSALAEQEAILISSRTKLALAELKKKGIKLCNPDSLILTKWGEYLPKKYQVELMKRNYYDIEATVAFLAKRVELVQNIKC